MTIQEEKYNQMSGSNWFEQKFETITKNKLSLENYFEILSICEELTDRLSNGESLEIIIKNKVI